MLFKLSDPESGRETHCGVLEFTAEEGCAYVPFWVMRNLNLEEGALLTVSNVSLPKATFVKLQPQSVDFLEVSNPRAILEHALRNFSCVTVGDIIQIPYNNKHFHLKLQDVKPSPAACIIETDCQVDFDAPVGYQEPSRPSSSSAASSMTGGSVSAGRSIPSAPPSLGLPSEVSAGATAPPEAPAKPPGIRIVDGVVVRPDASSLAASSSSSLSPQLLAPRVGATGVQRNAAVPEDGSREAPEASYWAIAAGDGARLDGKDAPALKDSNGKELDVRKLRAEAAAKRLQQQQEQQQQQSATTSASSSTASTAAAAPTAPVSKRKSKIAGKYSRLQQSGAAAFHGSARPVADGDPKAK